MKNTWLAIGVTGAFALLGCGSSVEGSGSGGCSGADCQSGTGTTGGAGGSGGCSGAGCSSGGAGGGAGGASVTSCGPMIGSCSSTEYCDFPDHMCGTGEPGTCKPRPNAEECYPDIVDTTCGCDGKTDTSECFVASDGADASIVGSCPTPEGTYPCGYVFCILGYHYCEVSKSLLPDGPDDFGCRQLPQSCMAAPDCACIAGVSCGGACEATPEGGLIVTCPGA